MVNIPMKAAEFAQREVAGKRGALVQGADCASNGNRPPAPLRISETSRFA